MIARAIVALALTTPAAAQQWEPLTSGVNADLCGVSAVSQRAAWVSGSRGTVLLTIDGGASWNRLVVPGADSLDFRDVHAFDARRAVILAIEPGDRSRVYTTDDAGATWTERFRNTRTVGMACRCGLPVNVSVSFFA